MAKEAKEAKEKKAKEKKAKEKKEAKEKEAALGDASHAILTGYHRPLAEQRQALDLGVPLVTKQYGKQMQVPPLPPLPPFCPVFCPVF